MKIKFLRILIIGNGSIGNRHKKIFKSIGLKTLLISSKDFFLDKVKINFKDFDVKNTIYFICNNTNLHFKTLQKIAKQNMSIFVEKPIIHKLIDLKKIKELIKKFNLKVVGGYVLRHDPRIIKLKEIIKKEKKNVLMASFNLQTYMPHWHKNENYKNRYLNKRKLGGGVLLTCCHEIDLAIYLFGEVASVYSKKINSNLKNDVENSVILILTHKNGIVSLLNLDFSNKIQFQRTLEVKTKKNIFIWDVNKNYLLKKKEDTIDKKIKFKNIKNLNNAFQNQSLSVLKNKNNFKYLLKSEELIFKAKTSLK